MLSNVDANSSDFKQNTGDNLEMMIKSFSQNEFVCPQQTMV